MEWQPIETALYQKDVYDGAEILLLTTIGITQARFDAGGWTENQEGREYDGAVWVCCDDQWQIEIEDAGPEFADWYYGMATHWSRLPPPPVTP